MLIIKPFSALIWWNPNRSHMLQDLLNWIFCGHAFLCLMLVCMCAENPIILLLGNMPSAHLYLKSGIENQNLPTFQFSMYDYFYVGGEGISDPSFALGVPVISFVICCTSAVFKSLLIERILSFSWPICFSLLYPTNVRHITCDWFLRQSK